MAEMPFQLACHHIFVQLHIDAGVIQLFGLDYPVDVTGQRFIENVFDVHESPCVSLRGECGFAVFRHQFESAVIIA